MRQMMQWFVSPVFQLIALPFIIVSNNYLANLLKITPIDFFITLVAFEALAVVLWCVVYGFSKKEHVSSSFVSLFCLYIFYLPTIVVALSESIMIHALLFLFFACAVIFFARKSATFLALNRLILVLFVLQMFVVFVQVSSIKTFDHAERENPLPHSQMRVGDMAAMPSVWHIVLDRYASAETLKRVYGYDNKDFYARLKDLGFVIVENPTANYQRTAQSLASVLNLTYLDNVARTSSNDHAVLDHLLYDNLASALLHRLNYSIYHFGSWWDSTRNNKYADKTLNYQNMPQLLFSVLDQSLFGYLVKKDIVSIPYVDGRMGQCERLHYQFDQMAQLAKVDERKFIFAHVLSPHPPFVLRKDGTCKRLTEAVSMSRRDNYIEQLEYTNTRILDVMTQILAHDRDAVIFLQSDEGPWPQAFAGDERFLGMDTTPVDWEKLNQDELREKVQILYAVRASDRFTTNLKDHPTPVNLYRFFFNVYAGAQYDVLPDRNLIFLNSRKLFDFRDITAKIK